MGKFWLKIWVWTKVIVFVLLSLYVLVFTIKNQGNKADVWVMVRHVIPTSTLVVALFAFLAGVIGTILVRTTVKTLRQIRDLQDRTRSEKLQREMEDMKAKAAMLRPKPVAGEEPETAV